MKNIPAKCSSCGAPIKWDKFSSYIDCEYCGKTTYIGIGVSPKVRNSIKYAKKLSASLFFKAKESSSKILGSNQFTSNKKLIFIIPITLLSIVLVGRLLNKRIVQFGASETICRVKKVRKKFIYLKGGKLDSAFIGCWKDPDIEGRNFTKIFVNKNKLELVVFFNPEDPEHTVNDKISFFKVSDIKFTSNSITHNTYIENTGNGDNYYVKSVYKVKNQNTLKIKWNFIRGGSFIGNNTLIRDVSITN